MVGCSQSRYGSFRQKKKVLEPRYFDIPFRNLSTTLTELSRNFLLKFKMQNSDMATARNIKFAINAFHCYSSRSFREEARTYNQTENNALPITFFTFSCGASTRFCVTAYSYVASRSLSLDTPHPVRLLVIRPTHRQHTTLARERETSSPPARFELTIPANERPQTDALDRAVTGPTR